LLERLDARAGRRHRTGVAASGDRNYALDLLRGLCAVAVAAYHYLHWSYEITVQSMGTFGVYTFFVLSALAMMIRYGRDFDTAISFDDARAFYRNRVARIMPLLAAVALFAMVYTNLKYDAHLWADWRRMLLTASGAFSLHMPGYLSIAVGAWSLGIELMFYLVFPVACLFAVNASPRALAVTTALLVVAQQFLIRQMPPVEDPAFWKHFTMPLTFAPFFAAGLLIYRLPLAERGANLAIGLAVLIAMLGFSAVVPVNLFKGGAPFIAMMALSALAVACMYRSRLPALAIPAAVVLGDISYSLYLTHWLAFQIADAAPPVIEAPLFVVIALGMAAAITYGFERPMRRLLASRPAARVHERVEFAGPATDAARRLATASR
jgi:peptidoglycan/LPS O-acetylase OafA/YrhL